MEDQLDLLCRAIPSTLLGSQSPPQWHRCSLCTGSRVSSPEHDCSSTSETERKSTLSASLQLFGSSGAGIRSSSGLLPSSVLFHRTLYVLTLGDGDATQATSADSSSTRKVVGASGRVVNVPVKGAEHVSTSLPKGTARCSTCFFFMKTFHFLCSFLPTCTPYFSPVPTISGNLEKLKVVLSPATKYSAVYESAGASIASRYLE